MNKTYKRKKLSKKMRKKLNIFYMKIFLCTIIIFSLGFIVGKINKSSLNVSSVMSNSLETVSYNKELKYEDIFPHSAAIANLKKLGKISDKDIEEMNLKIREYLGDSLDNVSISYYDISTGKTYNLNEKKELKAASTVKVPVSMMLYDAINRGEVAENDTMMFKSGDYEGSFGGLAYEDLSKPKSFEHINECMIIYSDNVAVNMLLRYFGNNKRYDYIEAIVGHKVNRSDNFTTAEDTMKILKKLYSNPDNNPYYDKIIDLMKRTSFHERLDKLVPQEIVAHKIGDYADNTGSYVHDVGIIYTKNPYILVVMSKNLSNSYNTIANISKIIYDVQTK